VHTAFVAVPADSAPVHTDFAPVSLRRLFGSRTVSYNLPRHSGVGFGGDFCTGAS
jgi:hypothetical protein